MNLNREELMSICEDGIVPCGEWMNRDSLSAQKQLSDIYSLLSVGADYTTKVDSDTIWITFVNITESLIQSISASLSIDSLEDYFELESSLEDDEMFEGNGLLGYGLDEIGGYIPTRKRLIEVNGSDWY